MRSRKSAIDMASERRTKSPCMECKRRAVGCHSACVDYGDYKKRLKQARQDMVDRNRRDILDDHYKKANRERLEKEHKR